MASHDKKSSNVRRFSRIVDIDNMTRPQVKAALDSFLRKGWELIDIYVEQGEARAVFVRTKEA